MNNKKGGFGAKLVLVLILMIASAVGGAYGYRVLDGKLAVRDAMKAVEDVDISDYDDEEQSVIQGYIDDATKNLGNAKTRKEVYEIIGDFIADVDKVQTSNEKKLEEALKAAEEAKQRYSLQNSSTNNDSTYNSGNTDSTVDSDSTDTAVTTDDTTDADDTSGSYKSNNLTNSGEEEESKGFLNSLLGGMSSGSSGD